MNALKLMKQTQMEADIFHLSRFVDVQRNAYDSALSELREGKKRSHWIWYIFPQLSGLGNSTNSEIYGISGLAEARAYLGNTLLGQRLRTAVETMLAHQSLEAAVVFGELDALKFRSCLTLFSLADPEEHIFSNALDVCFSGQSDPRTIELLKVRGET